LKLLTWPFVGGIPKEEKNNKKIVQCVKQQTFQLSIGLDLWEKYTV
jgi:hypothetical protein